MCGIFGYKWSKYNAYQVLLNWLKRLEYRWYDSAGMVVMNENWKTKIVKEVWKVSALSEKVSTEFKSDEHFKYGIAHTRWATHGWVTKDNTHPHYSTKKDFFIVHNGIIENFQTLKNWLEKKWYKFYSQTDTEIVVKLIEDNWTWDLLQTAEKVFPMLEGTYAILLISTKVPWEMIWVKYWSPLVFWYTDEWEFFFSSDTQALAWYVDNIIYLDDWDVVYLKNNDYLLKSYWKLIVKPVEKIDVSTLKAEKWRYKHFMLKEILEQPQVMREFFRWRINFENKTIRWLDMDKLETIEQKINNIVFIACWTSYHAWWLGTYWIQDLANIQSSVELASEFEYKNFNVNPNTLYIFISQSWETADSIQALKLVKDKWWKTFGIVNVVGSTISRLTDAWLFTRAGTEVWVASTKAFMAQITAILYIALYFGLKRWLSYAKFEQIINKLWQIPTQLEAIIQQASKIKRIAKNISWYKNIFFLWRHYQLPIAYEWSLKLKEISYIHSESYASWELKHWPLALIDKKIPSVILCPEDLLFDKNLSTLQEIKARNWQVLSISDWDVKSDWNINIPKTIEELYPFLTTLVSQLLAYYVADELGREIDKPRNLAKSVTVR